LGFFSKFSLNVAMLSMVVCTATSCTYSILVPQTLTEPTTVYLIDHGRTSSLVLPNLEGSYTRYAYGDHRWYALDDTGIWQGFAALFWPTPGALGRQDFVGDLSRYPNVLSIQVEVEGAKLHPDAYSLTNNSNTTVAGWLRQLGCHVKGWPWAFEWKTGPADSK